MLNVGEGEVTMVIEDSDPDTTRPAEALSRLATEPSPLMTRRVRIMKVLASL
jgi:hypothetical protein